MTLLTTVANRFCDVAHMLTQEAAAWVVIGAIGNSSNQIFGKKVRKPHPRSRTPFGWK